MTGPLISCGVNHYTPDPKEACVSRGTGGTNRMAVDTSRDEGKRDASRPHGLGQAGEGLWRDLGLTALSGVLVWLSFPPADMGAAAWVALAPWLVVVTRAPARRAAFLSGVVGYGVYVALLHWLRFVTVAGWLALAFYCALYWLVGALVFRWLRRRGLPFTLSAPIVFVVLEFARARLFTGFPFLLLGHTQYRYVPLIQVAAVTGVYGVTFMVALVNGLIADLVLDGARGRRRAYTAGAVVAVLLVAMLAGGLPPGRRVGRPRRILLVQGNVPISLKHSHSMENHLATLERHVSLALRARDGDFDLIVWPETMLPAPLNQCYDADLMLAAARDPRYRDAARLMQASRRAVERVARVTKAYQLVGSEAVLLGPFRRFNSAYFVSPDGAILSRYDKIHCVVFGEYTPLAGVLPFLKKLRPAVMGEDLSAGKIRRIFDLPGKGGPAHRFGVTICYEDSVADLFRRFVRDGADFMVNITNDGWFRDSSELDLHLAVCVMRAVENRVSVVRCANTGISAVIDERGRITQELTDENGRRREVEGTLAAAIFVQDTPRGLTFYTRYGDVFAWLCAAGLAAMAVAGQFRHSSRERRGRRRRSSGEAPPGQAARPGRRGPAPTR